MFNLSRQTSRALRSIAIALLLASASTVPALAESTATPDSLPVLEKDLQPLVRYPPRYPEKCMQRAAPSESVAVVFDVTAEGRTENIRVESSTNACLNSAVVQSVAKWRYAPLMVDGAPAKRVDVETVVTLELCSKSKCGWKPPIRHELFHKLARAEKRVQAEPEKALMLLADLEKEYAGSLNSKEHSALLRVRAAAKIQLRDYAGARDDLLAALELDPDNVDAPALQRLVKSLEAEVAAADTE